MLGVLACLADVEALHVWVLFGARFNDLAFLNPDWDVESLMAGQNNRIMVVPTRVAFGKVLPMKESKQNPSLVLSLKAWKLTHLYFSHGLKHRNLNVFIIYEKRANLSIFYQWYNRINKLL